MSFSRLQEARYELRQQELADVAFDRVRRTRDEGRGMEKIPSCPHCGRATVLLEHGVMPERRMSFSLDSEPERETSWLQCEWCGSEIDRALVDEKAPRKPAAKAEPDSERERRRA